MGNFDFLFTGKFREEDRKELRKLKQLRIRANRAVDHGVFANIEEALKAQEHKKIMKDHAFWIESNRMQALQAFKDGHFPTLEEAFFEQNQKVRRSRAHDRARHWLRTLEKSSPEEYAKLKAESMHLPHKHTDKFIEEFKDQSWFLPYKNLSGS